MAPSDVLSPQLTGDEIVALSKKHTIYEWSAQSKADPIPVARAKGIYFWTPEGKRYIDFNSQLMCVNIGHGDERVVRAIQEQAAVLAYANRSWPRSRAQSWARSWRRSRPVTSTRFFHQRRRGCQRKRDQDRALGDTNLRVLP
jgi:4-aminobutyrate aminotransferase-like enzyme